MPKSRIRKQHLSTQGKWGLSLLLTLPMALMLFVMLSGGSDVYSSPDARFAFATVWFLDVWLFFQMLYKGKTDRYRAVVFILFALTLSFTFITNMIEARGAMTFHSADLLQCKVPFCHIVTTMILIPAALSQSIIFPGVIYGSFASVSIMLVLVAGAILTIGKGFCSWGCFYGGWDDGFSRIGKGKKWRNPPTWLKWGGFAVLILVALTSASTLIPTYCDWACPFKAVTEYEAVNSVESAMKAIVFVSLFGGLVIVGPVLSKKRTQCAWFCPMGAFCAATDSISPFSIKVNKTACVKCRKCIEVCPVQALDNEAIEKGKAHIQCVKCGKCADVCPKGAIGFHLRFTQILHHPTTARMLFLYTSFGFLTIFSGGSLQKSILLLLKLAATGSILS